MVQHEASTRDRLRLEIDMLSYIIEDVTGRTLAEFFNQEIGSVIGTSTIVFPPIGGPGGTHQWRLGWTGRRDTVFRARSGAGRLYAAARWQMGTG